MTGEPLTVRIRLRSVAIAIAGTGTTVGLLSLLALAGLTATNPNAPVSLTAWLLGCIGVSALVSAMAAVGVLTLSGALSQRLKVAKAELSDDLRGAQANAPESPLRADENASAARQAEATLERAQAEVDRQLAELDAAPPANVRRIR